MVTTHFDLVSGPFWGPGGPKGARFGPERPFWGPRRALGSPGGPDLGPTVTGWSNWVGQMVGMLNAVIIGAPANYRVVHLVIFTRCGMCTELPRNGLENDRLVNDQWFYQQTLGILV